MAELTTSTTPPARKREKYLALGSSKVIVKIQCNPVDTTFVWPKTCGYTDKMAVFSF